MFDLEQSISNWRRQMFAAGITNPALEELESHLREEIEAQIQAGITDQKAFEVAVQRVGQADALEDEFKQAGDTKETTVGPAKSFPVLAVAIFVAVAVAFNIILVKAWPSPPTSFYLNRQDAGSMLEMYNKFAGMRQETAIMQSICLLDLLLLSLVLRFAARYPAPMNVRESRRRKRIASTGQLPIVCGGLFIIFSGSAPLGLEIAIISCAIFVVVLQRRDRMETSVHK